MLGVVAVLVLVVWYYRRAMSMKCTRPWLWSLLAPAAYYATGFLWHVVLWLIIAPWLGVSTREEFAQTILDSGVDPRIASISVGVGIGLSYVAMGVCGAVWVGMRSFARKPVGLARDAVVTTCPRCSAQIRFRDYALGVPSIICDRCGAKHDRDVLFDRAESES